MHTRLLAATVFCLGLMGCPMGYAQMMGDGMMKGGQMGAGPDRGSQQQMMQQMGQMQEMMQSMMRHMQSMAQDQKTKGEMGEMMKRMDTGVGRVLDGYAPDNRSLRGIEAMVRYEARAEYSTIVLQRFSRQRFR